ncbi:MAG: sigma-70 family RNA polymerase sigma factor, partial [Kiritimatiellae bacterium]|nr:sigma-70 family RNA polymerase sigma factor [Kiritimatiellia bacterium]
GGGADADDAFQDTWLRAIRHTGRFRGGCFRAGLTTTARHWLIDRARRRHPLLSLDAGDADAPAWRERLADGAPPPADRLAAEELRRRVETLVAALPAEQREVFAMRTQQELSFAEIAEMLKIPLNTALGRMHYAVTKLRRELEGCLDV